MVLITAAAGFYLAVCVPHQPVQRGHRQGAVRHPVVTCGASAADQALDAHRTA